MMDGMHGIGVAMMIAGVATALTVLTLIVLTALWLARDLRPARQSGGQQR